MVKSIVDLIFVSQIYTRFVHFSQSLYFY